MFEIREIKCSNCGLPADDEQIKCTYCYSSIDGQSTNPCNILIGIVILAIIVGLFAADSYFGFGLTDWLGDAD